MSRKSWLSHGKSRGSSGCKVGPQKSSRSGSDYGRGEQLHEKLHGEGRWRAGVSRHLEPRACRVSGKRGRSTGPEGRDSICPENSIRPLRQVNSVMVVVFQEGHDDGSVRWF